MRLLVRARAGEGGQEAVVDVDDWLVPRAKKFARQHLHVAREDDGVRADLGEMLQQCGLRLGLAIVDDRNDREGHLERARERFEVRMIADDADDVAVELAETMAAQEIHHAVREARNHDDNPVPLGVVEELPLEALPRQQRRHRGVEVL